MDGHEIDRKLKIARKEVREVLRSLAENIEPVHCFGEGQLRIAEKAIQATLDLDLAGELPRENLSPVAFPSRRAKG